MKRQNYILRANKPFKSTLLLLNVLTNFPFSQIITETTKLDDGTCARNDDQPNNPDLIREYLMRTREPPAIFQPSAMTTYNPLKALQQKFVNMAYKHPQLLIGDRDECDKIDSDSDENVMKTVANYNDHNKCRSTFKLNIFHDNNCADSGQVVQKSADNNSCRLIGNVKPNLIKTWEQLNGTMTSQADAMAIRSTEESNEKFNTQHEYNPMVYFSNNHILFDQNKSTASKNNESFVIKRPASQSGHFYDSIDNESVVTQDDDDQLIASLCDAVEHGGEAMAEYISLIEKKEKLCWSMDSCN